MDAVGGSRTVRGKLTAVVLLTTAIALLVAGTAMLTHDLSVYRRSWVGDLATEANILALSTAPALDFDDREVAERNLTALAARPSVLAAAIYDARGRRYADYARPGEAAPPLEVPRIGAALISGERVELNQRITRHGELLGTIYLRAQYDVSGRVLAYLEIFGLVMLMCMGVALVLSAALRRAITVPLDAMAEVARQIVDRRDYSLRARVASSDEIGIVVEAFNSMLDEVQTRARAFEISNLALRESEKLYRAIGESIDYGVWVTDAAGRAVYISESFLRLTGMTAAEAADAGILKYLHPDDQRSTAEEWRRTVRSGGVWYRELRVRGVDGVFHPILAQAVPVRGEDGAITGWAGINLDISRLKQTEAALRDADRRKDEFLATLAHELRNPLAPIRNAAKVLDSANIDESQRQWGRDVIARQVQRMALLLDDLLDVSRITRNRLELRKSRVDMTAVVGSAVETARPLIDARGHTLEIVLPPDRIELDADPLRLSQALSNLLTNAAKYTDSGGRITLRVELEPQSLSIAVQDTGIGLNPAVIPQLFEMFSQVDSALDRAEGGLGIGLALVKGLVALHGGTVHAASAGPGRGSAFTMRLPRSILASPEASANPETTSAGAGSSTPRRRVLIADDNRDAADSLALLLSLYGHEVQVASSGPEALELGRTQRSEVVILDIGMPGMSGYETAARIRKESWGRAVLLIAITGWGQEEDKARARAAGFDHHLTKPVDPDEVTRLLTQGHATIAE
jgi:PAS domain S-box-containing protein